MAPVLLAAGHLLGALHGQQVLLNGLILHAIPQKPNSQQLIFCCCPGDLLRQCLKLQIQPTLGLGSQQQMRVAAQYDTATGGVGLQNAAYIVCKAHCL